MTTQPTEPVQTSSEYAGILGDSEDSDDDPSAEQPVFWEALPILERLGLTSGAEMTEEEVENEFTQVALAFCCDRYTLSQRQQAGEHELTVAQDNMQREVDHTRDTLQILRGRYSADSEQSTLLHQMDGCLETVLASMDDVTRQAQALGAAHQEARVICAAELMQLHVNHLKHCHTTNSTELLETRKLLHQHREDIDLRHQFFRQASQQHLRRRVSITLIPSSQAQMSDMEARFQEGFQDSSVSESASQAPEDGRFSQDTSPCPILAGGTVASSLLRQSSSERFQGQNLSSPDLNLLFRQSSTQSCQSNNDEGEAICFPSPQQVSLRHRHRSAILEGDNNSKKAEDLGPESEESMETPSELSTADSIISEHMVELSDQQSPMVSWQSYLLPIFLLSFLLLLGLLFWGLRYSRFDRIGTTPT